MGKTAKIITIVNEQYDLITRYLFVCKLTNCLSFNVKPQVREGVLLTKMAQHRYPDPQPGDVCPQRITPIFILNKVSVINIIIIV